MKQKTVLLVINPKSRHGSESSEELLSALKESGYRVLRPESGEDCRDFIRANAKDADVVLVGGGDGTINYVLSALVETQLPLVVFPLGTANLLARSFNLKADVEELLETLRSGVSVPIDLGVVNDIYFINVCGLGISTEVNKSVPSRLKKIMGPLSFWIQGLKLLRHLEPFRITMAIDDQPPVKTKTWQITICNGRKYAAWMTIQPDASYDDGKLRCLSTEVTKWWEGFKLLPSYIRGTYREDLDATFKTGKKIRIEAKRKLSIDVDGDVQTKTPAVFEVRTKAMKIILPATASAAEDMPIKKAHQSGPEVQLN